MKKFKVKKNIYILNFHIFMVLNWKLNVETNKYR